MKKFLSLLIVFISFGFANANELSIKEIEKSAYSEQVCKNILINGIIKSSQRADRGHKTETPEAIERWSTIMSNYANIYNIFCKNK